MSQDDYHLLTALRYVEANALRAGLVERAERWKWSSLWAVQRGGEKDQRPDAWPIARPRDWIKKVNAVMTKPELQQLRDSLKRGRPFGDEAWMRRTADTLGLQFTLRDRGRPKRGENEEK
jgi:putative transposase